MTFELLDAQRVLAVQPHYDDNDIAAGGTLALLAQHGARVVYATVTDDLAGVLDASLDDAAARAGLRAEQHAAGELVGVAAQHWLDWPDAAGLDQIAVRDQLVALIRAERPDVVLTCDPWLAYEAHSDHIRTGLATCEAAMLASLPRFCPQAGAPHSVTRVALCFTARPNVVVDTSAVQDVRHRTLDCYRMQFADDGLASLHAAVDAFERSRAPEGATHGEGLLVVPPGALHVGIGLAG